MAGLPGKDRGPWDGVGECVHLFHVAFHGPEVQGAAMM